MTTLSELWEQNEPPTLTQRARAIRLDVEVIAKVTATAYVVAVVVTLAVVV